MSHIDYESPEKAKADYEAHLRFERRWGWLWYALVPPAYAALGAIKALRFAARLCKRMARRVGFRARILALCGL